MLAEAHKRLGAGMKTMQWMGDVLRSIDTAHLGGILPCMVSTEWVRRVMLKLEAGEFVEVEMLRKHPNLEKQRVARERYDLDGYTSSRVNVALPC